VDASWVDMSNEDAAEGDNSGPSPGMDATLAAELQADPYLALPAAQLSSDPSLSPSLP